MKKKIDWFIVGLMAMITIAYFIPGIGNKDSMFPLENITNIGISIIFFFYGLKLSPRDMQKGLRNYRLHLLIQLGTFLFFPLLALCLKPFFLSETSKTLWLAIFFMAALPSTVSSSVVMVSLAKGNVAGAIFNASISGLIGIIITPLWIGLFFNTTGSDFNMGSTIVSLLLHILLPVLVGLALHRKLGAFAAKYKRILTLFDKTIILLIVYNSFSSSFENGIFNNYSIPILLITAVIIMAFLGIIYLLIWTIAGWLGFNMEDKITAVFCGSKKSLVHGTVMSNVLLEGMKTQGIFIVPIMIYHSFQLIIISFIAQRLALRKHP